MTQLNKRMYALLLTAAVSITHVTYGMEVEMIEEEEVVEVARTAWYKEHSVQIAATVIAGAAFIYATALYMDKVSSPAELLKKLLPAKATVTTESQNITGSSTEGKDHHDNNKSEHKNHSGHENKTVVENVTNIKPTVDASSISNDGYTVDTVITYVNNGVTQFKKGAIQFGNQAQASFLAWNKGGTNDIN